MAGLGERPWEHPYAQVDRQMDRPVLPAELPSRRDAVGGTHVLAVQEPLDDPGLHEIRRGDVAREPCEPAVPPLLVSAEKGARLARPGAMQPGGPATPRGTDGRRAQGVIRPPFPTCRRW